MSHRALSIVAIISLTAAPCLAQGAQQAKSPAAKAPAWTQPKLPWGDPDLQGTWTSDDYINVPLQPKRGNLKYRTPNHVCPGRW